MVAIVCIVAAAALLLWPSKVEPQEAEAPPAKKSRPRSRKEPKS